MADFSLAFSMLQKIDNILIDTEIVLFYIKVLQIPTYENKYKTSTTNKIAVN